MAGDSYGSCVVQVPDVGEAFAAGLLPGGDAGGLGAEQ